MALTLAPAHARHGHLSDDAESRPRLLLRIVLLAVAALVLSSFAVMVWFPGSRAAVLVGWAIYLFIAVFVQPWGPPMIGALAAAAAIWWVLTRR